MFSSLLCPEVDCECNIVNCVAGYRNTEQASRFLVSDSPVSLHGYILHCNDMVWPLFSHLENAVLEGTSQHERAFGKKNEDVFQVDTCFLLACTFKSHWFSSTK